MTSAGPAPGSPPHHGSPSGAASPPSKRDLKSWWKGFKLPSKHHESHESRPHGIFGVPLRQSITYANVAISLIDENGKSYIYGYVPIVVAKCGVFLKEKATGVEGIFRLSGSEKRIKELKTIFDSPDRYGKGLVWEGYTVHDAANVLRRYLNDLPEPVVPLDLYEKFRDPLRGATKQAVGDAEGPQFVENFDERAAIEKYQQLITELPPLNRQLLLYILDLLAVFAAKSDENRMNSQNLAAIFQPGMLSHPAHAMAPEEYRLNQCVIIFLIENQDHFLIGMQGTAADEKTKQEVEKGTPVLGGPVVPRTPRTPGTGSMHSGLGRSASNASAGAESVRRDGKVRRNRSTSSRHSRQEGGAATPGSPGLATTPTGGLTRSNTVPSKKSPALPSGRFQKDPSPASQPVELTETHVVSPGEKSPAASSIEPASLAPGSIGGAGRSQERLLEPGEPVSTPMRERTLQSLFQRTPTSDSDRRQPNKLKKRAPGSKNHSAQSSNASLPISAAVSPSVEVTNPLEPREFPDLGNPNHPAQQPVGEAASEPTPRGSQAPPSSTLHPENTLKPKKSPPTSLHSSFNEGSDLDQLEEIPSGPGQVDAHEKERKRRWRISRSKKEEAAPHGQPIPSPRAELGSNSNAEMSSTSVGSGQKNRKSFTIEGSDPALAVSEAHAGHDSGYRERGDRDVGKDDSKGPIGWIRNKYREAKENAEHRRNKSPPADKAERQSFSGTRKSVDVRGDDERHTHVPPVPPVPIPPSHLPPPPPARAE